MAGCCSGASGLVAACVAMMAITVLTAYAIASALGDVYPGFPMISDTGSFQPESGVFAVLLSVTTFLVFAVMVVRYHLVRRLDSGNGVRKYNIAALIIGFIVCIGMLMVAAFQSYDSSIPHLVGAYTLFVGGTIYGILHTIISYKLDEWKMLFYIRLSLNIATILLVVLYGIFSSIASSKKPPLSEIDPDCPYRLNDDQTEAWSGYWNPCMPGYDYHVLSAVCEWLVAACFAAYFLTFYPDFKHFGLGLNLQLSLADNYWPVPNSSSSRV
eukprot:m.72683 g.72683  ORF g.72683 m.72683 type:complete len:270 (-) comp14422_c0_seq2:183-992(-)